MTADEFIAAWELAFPRYVNAGIASSGPGKPNKLLVEQLGQKIADLVAASGGGDGTLAYATVAAMNADLAHDANTQAAVYADPGGDTTNHNGMWTKVGASGSGSWTWLRSLSIVELSLRLDALEALNIDARLDAVEANSDTMAAYRREMTERPGDAPELFADAYTGSPDASTQTVLAPVTAAEGKVLRIAGPGILARRGFIRLEPDRKYLVRAIVQRAVDPTDPNNDAVRMGMAWFTNAGSAVSGTPITILATFSALTVASGRTQHEAIIATASGDDITNVAPATTVYARPYIQTFGGGGSTSVEVLSVKDVTDAIGDSIAQQLVDDAIAAAAQVASVESNVEDLRDDAVAAAAGAGADLWTRPITSFVSSEPGSPTTGDRVLLDETNATHPNQIAERFSGAWHYSGAPKDGQPVWDSVAQCIRRYSSTAGKWKKSANKAVLLSWFVDASGNYDYSTANTFANSAGILLKGDVDIDVSGIGGSGITFTADYKPAGGIIKSGSKTVTFARFIPARRPAFYPTDTGLVTFGNIDEVYPILFSVVGDGTTDDTTQIQRMIAAVAASGTPPIIGNKRHVHYFTGNAQIVSGMAVRRLNLDHYPANTTTDLVTVIGGDYSPNFDAVRIEDCQFRGQQGGATNGRDLIRINRGDHIQLKNVLLAKPVRDGLHVEPDANGHWIEDLTLENVKAQSAGRDSFRCELPDTLTTVFINKVSGIQCESRGAAGSALSLICSSTVAAANKLSAHTFLNCEFGASGAVSTPIVAITGPASGGSVENVVFEGCDIEDTAAARTGWGILITGRVTGSFKYKAGTIFGTASGRISGANKFGWYDVDSGTTSDVSLRSHSGSAAPPYRTASLAQNATENADWILNAADTLKVYGRDRFATYAWRGEWTVYGTTQIAAVGSPANMTLAIVTSGSDKVLQITNTSATAQQLEIYISRVASRPGT